MPKHKADPNVAVDLAMMVVRALWPDDTDLPVDLVGCTTEYMVWLAELPVVGQYH